MPPLLGHPAALVVLGLVIGFVGTLVGVGGGFLFVPYFRGVLGWTHLRSVGTSLGIVLVNATSGTMGYARQRLIDWQLALVLALGTVPGTFAGKFVAERVTGGAFNIAFAAVAIAAAFYLATFQPERAPRLGWFRRGRAREVTDPNGVRHEYSVNLPFGAAASVVVGFVSGMFGVGGGFLHVPMLIVLYGMPPHAAAATSTFALSITAATGTVLYAAARPEPQVDPVTLLYAGVGAFAGAQAATVVSRRLSGRALRLVLAAVLAAVGATMAWKGLTVRSGTI